MCRLGDNYSFEAKVGLRDNILQPDHCRYPRWSRSSLTPGTESLRYAWTLLLCIEVVGWVKQPIFCKMSVGHRESTND